MDAMVLSAGLHEQDVREVKKDVMEMITLIQRLRMDLDTLRKKVHTHTNTFRKKVHTHTRIHSGRKITFSINVQSMYLKILLHIYPHFEINEQDKVKCL